MPMIRQRRKRKKDTKMRRGWILSAFLWTAALCAMEEPPHSTDSVLTEDPILQELQQISQADRTPGKPEANSTRALSPQGEDHRTVQSTDTNLSDTRESKVPDTAEHGSEARPPEASFTPDPHPVTYDPHTYLGLKKVPLQPADPVDPRRYLSLKRIVDPMPEEYAKTYLKMKTLLNPTQTYVIVHIDKPRQQMRVYLDNDYIGGWKVSTARRGYWTPTGVYRPYTLHRMHYSRKYHHSPMPWSVFFKGGYAIHGTNAIRRLGRPASHGCVRVHPRNAKILYQLIRRYGKQNTRIIING